MSFLRAASARCLYVSKRDVAVLLAFSGPEYPPIESLEIKTGSVLHIAIS